MAKLAGYAYANSYRARIAYQWTVENSVYVDGTLPGPRYRQRADAER